MGEIIKIRHIFGEKKIWESLLQPTFSHRKAQVRPCSLVANIQYLLSESSELPTFMAELTSRLVRQVTMANPFPLLQTSVTVPNLPNTFYIHKQINALYNMYVILENTDKQGRSTSSGSVTGDHFQKLSLNEVLLLHTSICPYMINWKRGPLRCCYVVTMHPPPHLRSKLLRICVWGGVYKK